MPVYGLVVGAAYYVRNTRKRVLSDHSSFNLIRKHKIDSEVCQNSDTPNGRLLSENTSTCRLIGVVAQDYTVLPAAAAHIVHVRDVRLWFNMSEIHVVSGRYIHKQFRRRLSIRTCDVDKLYRRLFTKTVRDTSPCVLTSNHGVSHGDQIHQVRAKQGWE